MPSGSALPAMRVVPLPWYRTKTAGLRMVNLRFFGRFDECREVSVEKCNSPYLDGSKKFHARSDDSGKITILLLSLKKFDYDIGLLRKSPGRLLNFPEKNPTHNFNLF
jgi:hypothetical protein